MFTMERLRPNREITRRTASPIAAAASSLVLAVLLASNVAAVQLIGDRVSTARPATLVAGQTMDDARRAALYGDQTTVPTGQTVDDARRAALYQAQVTPRVDPGVGTGDRIEFKLATTAGYRTLVFG